MNDIFLISSCMLSSICTVSSSSSWIMEEGPKLLDWLVEMLLHKEEYKLVSVLEVIVLPEWLSSKMDSSLLL